MTPGAPPDPSAPEIGEARADDVDALVALVNAAYRGDTSRRGWTTEADLIGGQRVDAGIVSEELAHEHRRVLVARRGEDLVACCEIEHVPGAPDARLGMFAVHPDHQAEGLGRRMLEAGAELARERGAHRLLLAVIEQRHELIAWYGRRGFSPTGETEPFPYGDERLGLPRRDDLRMLVLARPLRPGLDREVDG